MISFDIFKEWLPSITEKKGYLFEKGKDEEIERAYPSFMINRALSQYEDTVLIANEVNRLSSNLDPKLQYDFLYHLVPKKRRFSKWAKPQKSNTINMIVEAYSISARKAEEVSDLFSEEDIENLKSYLYKGGKNEGKS